MDARELLKKELDEIPDNLLEDLYDYMKYLKYKKHRERDKIDTAYASEKVLKKEWDNPEEDSAWKNL
jgi:hypothetical protein